MMPADYLDSVIVDRTKCISCTGDPKLVTKVFNLQSVDSHEASSASSGNLVGFYCGFVLFKSLHCIYLCMCTYLCSLNVTLLYVAPWRPHIIATSPDDLVPICCNYCSCSIAGLLNVRCDAFSKL